MVGAVRIELTSVVIENYYSTIELYPYIRRSVSLTNLLDGSFSLKMKNIKHIHYRGNYPGNPFP